MDSGLGWTSSVRCCRRAAASRSLKPARTSVVRRDIWPTRSALPVHSCEANPVFFAIARKELAGTQNVDLHLGDSRTFLNELVSRGVHEGRSFFYLDAHWNDDLPLVEEIEIIAGNWREFVVMIDDFQVPGDDGYGFDDYGTAKQLSLRDFGPTFERNGLVPFSPRASSAEESGYARGCVVLARRGELSETLADLENRGATLSHRSLCLDRSAGAR